MELDIPENVDVSRTFTTPAELRLLSARELTEACPELITIRPSQKRAFQPFQVLGLTQPVPNPEYESLKKEKEAALQRLRLLTYAHEQKAPAVDPLLSEHPFYWRLDKVRDCPNPTFYIPYHEISMYLHLFLETDAMDRERHETHALNLLRSVYNEILGTDTAYVRAMRLQGTLAFKELQDREARRLEPDKGIFPHGVINPIAMPLTIDEVYRLFQELIALSIRRAVRFRSPLLQMRQETLQTLEEEETRRIQSLTFQFLHHLGHPKMHIWWKEYQRLAELQHPEARPGDLQVDVEQERRDERILSAQWEYALQFLYPNGESRTFPGPEQMGESLWVALSNWTREVAAEAASHPEAWWSMALTDEYVKSRYRYYLTLVIEAARLTFEEKDLLLGLESYYDKTLEETGQAPTVEEIRQKTRIWKEKLLSTLEEIETDFTLFLRLQYNESMSFDPANTIDILPQLEELPEKLYQSELVFLNQLLTKPALLPDTDNENEDGLIFLERWEDHIVKKVAQIFRLEAVPYLQSLSAIPDLNPASVGKKKKAEELAQEELNWFLDWNRRYKALLHCWKWNLLGNAALGDADAGSVYNTFERKKTQTNANYISRLLECTSEVLQIPAVYEMDSHNVNPLLLQVRVEEARGPEWSSSRIKPPYTYVWLFSPFSTDLASGEQMPLMDTSVEWDDFQSEEGRDPTISRSRFPSRDDNDMEWRVIREHTTQQPFDELQLIPTSEGFDLQFRGYYRCVVTALLEDKQTEQTRTATARSETATLLVRYLCVRCGDWYEPGKHINTFGSCKWMAPPLDAELRLLQADYRGLLEQKIELKLEGLQTELEASQNRRLFYADENQIEDDKESTYQRQLLLQTEQHKEELKKVLELPHFETLEEDASYAYGFLSRLRQALLYAEAEANQLSPKLAKVFGLTKGESSAITNFIKAYPLFFPVDGLSPNEEDDHTIWRKWYENDMQPGENPLLTIASEFLVSEEKLDGKQVTLDMVLREQPDYSLLLENPLLGTEMPVYSLLQLALYPPVKRHLISYDIQLAKNLLLNMGRLGSELIAIGTPTLSLEELTSHTERTGDTRFLLLTHIMANVSTELATANYDELRSLFLRKKMLSESVFQSVALVKDVKEAQKVAQSKQRARTGTLQSDIEYVKRPHTEIYEENELRRFCKKRHETNIFWKGKHSRTNPYPTPWDVVAGVRGNIPCGFSLDVDHLQELDKKIRHHREKWLRAWVSRHIGISPQEKPVVLRDLLHKEHAVRFLEEEDLQDTHLKKARKFAIQFNKLQRQLVRIS